MEIRQMTSIVKQCPKGAVTLASAGRRERVPDDHAEGKASCRQRAHRRRCCWWISSADRAWNGPEYDVVHGF